MADTPSTADAVAPTAAALDGDDGVVVRKLRDLIAFYFSAANLRKDRFLQQTMDADPGSFVSIDAISTFNRVKQLNATNEQLLRAFRDVECVELNDDATKVRPKAGRPEPKDEDACTVYVEGLPTNANHDFLKAVFGNFGTVEYISIPRHKNKQRSIKGFAFVEYDTPAAAERCADKFGTERSLQSVADAATFCWGGLMPEGLKLPVRTLERCDLTEEEAFARLRVLPKVEWARLKMEYKALQRQQMAQYKKDLRGMRESEPSEDRPPIPREYPKGVLVSVHGLPEDGSKLAIKDRLEQLGGSVTYVDYLPGNTQGIVRFSNPESARETAAKLPAEDGPQWTCTIMEGSDEAEYWAAIEQQKASRRERQKKRSANKRKKARDLSKMDAPKGSAQLPAAAVSTNDGPARAEAPKPQERSAASKVAGSKRQSLDGKSEGRKRRRSSAKSPKVGPESAVAVEASSKSGRKRGRRSQEGKPSGERAKRAAPGGDEELAVAGDPGRDG